MFFIDGLYMAAVNVPVFTAAIKMLAKETAIFVSIAVSCDAVKMKRVFFKDKL